MATIVPRSSFAYLLRSASRVNNDITAVSSRCSTIQSSTFLLSHKRGFSTKVPASTFLHYETRQSRWNDNDAFHHINNSIYYQYMDDAINRHLLDRGIGQEYLRFIAENGIQYYRPISFPSNILVGIRVVHLGSSAVTYDVGFVDGGTTTTSQQLQEQKDKSDPDEQGMLELAARGKFVHVYVDESTGRPMPIAPKARAVLETLLVEEEELPRRK